MYMRGSSCFPLSDLKQTSRDDVVSEASCLSAYPSSRVLVVANPQVPFPGINFSPVEEVGSPILADLPLLHIAHSLGRWKGNGPFLSLLALQVVCCGGRSSSGTGTR